MQHWPMTLHQFKCLLTEAGEYSCLSVMSGYWIDVSIKIYENQCISSIKYKDKVTILLNIKKTNKTNPQFRHSLLCLFNSTFSGQDRQEPRLAKSLVWRSGNASPERDIAAFQVNTQYNTSLNQSGSSGKKGFIE